MEKKKQCDALNKNLGARKNEFKNLNKENDQINYKIQKLNLEIGEMSEEMSILAQKTQAHKGEKEETEQKIGEIKDSIEKLEEEIRGQ